MSALQRIATVGDPLGSLSNRAVKDVIDDLTTLVQNNKDAQLTARLLVAAATTNQQLIQTTLLTLLYALKLDDSDVQPVAAAQNERRRQFVRQVVSPSMDVPRMTLGDWASHQFPNGSTSDAFQAALDDLERPVLTTARVTADALRLWLKRQSDLHSRLAVYNPSVSDFASLISTFVGNNPTGGANTMWHLKSFVELSRAKGASEFVLVVTDDVRGWYISIHINASRVRYFAVLRSNVTQDDLVNVTKFIGLCQQSLVSVSSNAVSGGQVSMLDKDDSPFGYIVEDMNEVIHGRVGGVSNPGLYVATRGTNLFTVS